MTREILKRTTVATTLNIISSEVAGVRTNDETETALRLIDGEVLGLASAVGATDIDTLTRQAQASRDFRIHYPVHPETDTVREIHYPGRWRTLDEMVRLAGSVFSPLASEFPQYTFDGRAVQTRTLFTIQNDLGLDLSYERVQTDVVWGAKERGSGRIVDAWAGTSGPDVDVAAILDDARQYLRADQNKLTDIPSGRQRMIFPMLFPPLIQSFTKNLTAESYGKRASIFADPYDEKTALFHPDVRLVDCRDSAAVDVEPFDIEGILRDNPNLDLIRDGRICGFFANKRDAHEYGLPRTGCAGGAISGAPTSSPESLRLLPTTETLADLLNGESGILVHMTAGGSVTPSGDIGMPCQIAYRVEPDGTLSGRVPDLMLSSSLYNVFGDGFIGVSKERNYLSKYHYLASFMDVGAGR